MNCLASNGIVEQYRPLTDIKGSYSAQFEHVSLDYIPSDMGMANAIIRLSSYTRRTKRSLVAETTTDMHPPTCWRYQNVATILTAC